MLKIIVRGGCGEACIDPHLAIGRQNVNIVQIMADKFGHLLPDGTHALRDLAAAMEEGDSLVKTAYAQELRNIQANHAPDFLATPAFVTHEENTVGRDFVVSDIHGQYNALQEALRSVAFDRKRDRLFSVGDLIDRGARSFDCLSLVFEGNVHVVLGNHELMALTALGSNGTQDAWDHWQQNGGAWVLGENVREVAIIAQEAARYLPLGREVLVAGKRVGICHAEPPANWNWLKDSPETLVEPTVWGRTRITKKDTTPVEGIDVVVVGHTILDEPTWLGNVLHIDTGACTREGELTLLNLRDLV